jgi:hypothetical protein
MMNHLQYQNIFRILGFSDKFNSVSFLLSSCLGAGLDKWKSKPLGAHQRRFDGGSEREHSCLPFTAQITFPVLKIRHS